MAICSFAPSAPSTTARHTMRHTHTRFDDTVQATCDPKRPNSMRRYAGRPCSDR